MLKNALDFAAKGFHVFPLLPNSKLPAITDYPTRATRDPEAIKKFWLDPVMGIEQPFNIGISTSKYGDDEALVVVDIDNKEGDKGEASLLSLPYELPETAMQITPTGGRHLIYKHKVPVKQGAHVLGPCLDIRSKGGYIVAAGSKLEGTPYIEAVANAGVSYCPPEVIEECGKAPERDENHNVIIEVDRKNAHSRAEYYLSIEAPEAIEGQGGDQTTFQVITTLKDYGVLKEDCSDLLFEWWYDGCGWTPEELQKKIDNAYHYGQEAVGSKSPEAVFSKVEKSEKLSPLRQLNKDFAIVFMQGSHYILHETTDADGHPVTHYMSEASFKRMHSDKTLQEGEKFKKLANVWLDWEHRRMYNGVCFMPGKNAPADHYNLWKGFAVDPADPDKTTEAQRKGLKMYLDHIRENVAQGDEQLFNWVMCYFAQMIQRPWEKTRTSMAFRGGKGVGKNIMANCVGRLLDRDSYTVASNGRYLTSNFNGHLESNVLLVLDEAFWSGDKAAEGMLKGLVTEEKILIERKGKEPYMSNNFTRLVILGNEDWIVPSTQDERRFAVFEVGDGRKQDIEYFSELNRLMTEENADQLLLTYLLNFDLSLANIDVIPNTQALGEQKEHSHDIILKWFKDCLLEGELVGLPFSKGWKDCIRTNEIKEAIHTYAKEMNYRHRLPDVKCIGRKLAPFVSRNRRMEEGQRFWVYWIGDLEEAREKWDKEIGYKTAWEKQ